MNAQLLTAFSDAPTSKAGTGALALLSRLAGTKNGVDGEGGASFADLLDQQAEAIDPQLLEMFNEFGLGHLDQQSRGELLTQLKQLGISNDQLNVLSLHLHSDNKEIKALVNDLRQLVTETQRTPQTALPLAAVDTKSEHTPQNPQNSRDFISSTLFVANESKALRTERFATPLQPIKATTFSIDTKAVPTINIDKTSTKTELNLNTSATTGLTPAVNPTTLLQELTSSQSHNSGSGNNVLLQLNQPIGQNSTTGTGPNAFTPMFSAQINTPVLNTVQWGADFGRVMVQMSQQAHAGGQTGLQTAEIRLDPPELGPMRIMLSINEGVANAMIFAAHAQTRQAVELSLPQLQQQLAQSGLSLGEANVSDQGFFAQSDQQFDQNQAQSSETFSLNGVSQDTDNESFIDENAKQSNDPNAIIDTFA